MLGLHVAIGGGRGGPSILPLSIYLALVDGILFLRVVRSFAPGTALNGNPAMSRTLQSNESHSINAVWTVLPHLPQMDGGDRVANSLLPRHRVGVDNDPAVL
jgi:hypothetical protein